MNVQFFSVKLWRRLKLSIEKNYLDYVLEYSLMSVIFASNVLCLFPPQLDDSDILSLSSPNKGKTDYFIFL